MVIDEIKHQVFVMNSEQPFYLGIVSLGFKCFIASECGGFKLDERSELIFSGLFG
jgi:hypothetical protein